MPSLDLQVRSADAGERGWIEDLLRETWGLPIVSRGRVCDLSEQEGLVCVAGGERVGLATFEVRDGDCELVTIVALAQHGGVGTALLSAVIDAAASRRCGRLWLITTNDNLDALRFYQRRGMRLAAVHPGAMDEARRIKPSIPLVGCYAIALHDEVELELRLR